MIQEVVRILIDPKNAAAFEEAVAKAAPLFLGSKGCHGLQLCREVETAGGYRLLVAWETIEDHMVTFRNAPAFQEWRALAGPFFLAPPEVIHLETVQTFPS